MRTVVVSLLLLCAFKAWTQNGAEITKQDGTLPVTADKDSVRRYYIKGFPDYFFIYPILKQRGLNFELKAQDSNALLTYKPNNTYNLGLGLYVFELGVEFGFAIPLQEQSIERYGRSDARDLHLNILAKRWGLNALAQRYSGFYIVDKDNKPAGHAPYPQRPDLVTKNFGLSWHYIFNHQKFSFRSAYNFSERQLYSHGSFLLFASLYTFRLAGDSSIVPHANKAEFGAGVDFTRLRHTSFSIAPGYTINLTYRHFFLNTTLGFGPAHNWINYDLAGNPRTQYDIAINPFLSARLAMGYNGYRLFGGISFMSEGNTIRFDGTTFSNSSTTFKLLVGYRFREVGILKKRIWDLLPFEL